MNAPQQSSSPSLVQRAARLIGVATAGLGALVGVVAVVRAVTVSPTGLVIDHRTRVADIVLYNPTDSPEELTTELRYGLHLVDSASGEMVVRFFHPDSIPYPSMTGWSRTFPRRIVLAPGKSQNVRVIASPPAGLADGEYWGRFVVTSRQLPNEGGSDSAAARAAIAFTVTTTVPIWYRKGALTTAAQVDTAEAIVRGDTMLTTVALRREGTAAFLGVVRVRVIAPNGAVVGASETGAAIYTRWRRRFAVPLPPSAPRGAYTVEVSVTSGRGDLKPSDALPAAPILKRLPVVVP
jgi:hypothetical protein